MSKLQPIIKSFSNKAKLETNETLVWNIELHNPPGCSGELPEIGDKIQGLRVIDFEKIPPKDFRGLVKQERIYKLNADLSGTYLLPSIKVKIQCPDKSSYDLATTEIFVEFGSTASTSTAANANAKNTMKDIIDIKPIYQKNMPLTPYLIGAGILILLAGIIYYLRKKRKADKHLPEIKQTPFERAMEQLEILKNSVKQENTRDHVFSLSFILREFLEGSFNIPVTDLTLEEIKQKSLDCLNQDHRRQFITYLEKMDFIKFTNMEPNVEEYNTLHMNVYEWVQNFKPSVPDPLKETQEGDLVI